VLPPTRPPPIRYRDFQVREIDREGRVARLESAAALPPPPAEAPPAEAPPPPAAKLPPPPPPELDDAAAAELTGRMTELAGEENGRLFAAFLESLRAAKAAAASAPAGEPPAAAPPPPVLLLRPVADKDARRGVHTLLKSDPRLPAIETDAVQARAFYRGRVSTDAEG